MDTIIVSCPKCSNYFKVDTNALGEGRRVRCTSCFHVWWEDPDDWEEDPDNPAGEDDLTLDDVQSENSLLQSDQSKEMESHSVESPMQEFIVEMKQENKVVVPDSKFFSGFMVFSLIVSVVVWVIFGSLKYIPQRGIGLPLLVFSDSLGLKAQRHFFIENIKFSIQPVLENMKEEKEKTPDILLSVTMHGVIINRGDSVKKLFLLEGIVYDKGKHRVGSFSYDFHKKEMKAGEAITFKVYIGKLPRDAHYVVVNVCH